MAVDPDTLDDPAKLRELAKNARRHGREDIALRCLTRIAELHGQKFDAGLEREFWMALIAAEEIVTERNGKTTRLSRTRQKMQKVGIFKTIVDLAIKPGVSEGFKILVDGGRADLTAEAIVLRHKDIFDTATVEMADKKLRNAGVDGVA